MQKVAAEMNHAETAFLQTVGNDYELRWFTPAVEVDLCGHATLASAHILFTKQGREGTIKFHTRSGCLTATRAGDQIELDFPADPPQEIAEPAGLSDALGAQPLRVCETNLGPIAELCDARTVRELMPDIEALRRYGKVGVLVTAKSDDPAYDFISRFFAPQAGLPEDSVTGSAHCGLAAYWAPILGKSVMTGFQASKRGGVVGVEIKGDRVLLRGNAVTVLEGDLCC